MRVIYFAKMLVEVTYGIGLEEFALTFRAESI